jgi:hypothetical protein
VSRDQRDVAVTTLRNGLTDPRCTIAPTTMTNPKPSTGPEMFASLREMLFGRYIGAMTGGAAAGADDVLGVVMEMGLPNGTALVFGLNDGSASVYFGSGGGHLGGQGRPHINAAAKRLVGTAKGLVAKLSPTREHPLPAAGRVRFSIFTPAGLRAAEAAESELIAGNSELTPLFVGAHQIITGFRMADEARKPNERLYINLLLTALARGHVASVVLTAGDRLPDPASLTDDAQDLDWFTSLGMDLDVQSAEKVIHLLLEAAGFRRFHLRKTEGLIQALLEAHDGASATSSDFKVTKQSHEGRVRIEVARVTA